MLYKKVSESVLDAIKKSPAGMATLDVLESLQLCGPFTLKTTLSRLNKSGRILRLKRGAYSTNPMRDAFACAQTAFNGYLGFSSALYLHKLITEIPFTIMVATTYESKKKQVGEYLFQGVALKEKAIGFEKMGEYTVSTRAKTLFDCLYLPRYSVGSDKLLSAFKDAKLKRKEWAEFDAYVEKLAGKKAELMKGAKKEILGG